MYRAFEGGGLAGGAGGRCEMDGRVKGDGYRIWVRAFGGWLRRGDVLLLLLAAAAAAGCRRSCGWDDGLDWNRVGLD